MNLHPAALWLPASELSRSLLSTLSQWTLEAYSTLIDLAPGGSCIPAAAMQCPIRLSPANNVCELVVSLVCMISSLIFICESHVSNG